MEGAGLTRSLAECAGRQGLEMSLGSPGVPEPPSPCFGQLSPTPISHRLLAFPERQLTQGSPGLPINQWTRSKTESGGTDSSLRWESCFLFFCSPRAKFICGRWSLCSGQSLRGPLKRLSTLIHPSQAA